MTATLLRRPTQRLVERATPSGRIDAEAGVIHERSRGRRRNPKPPGIGARVAYKTAGLADTALGAYEDVTSAIGATAHEALRDVQADTGVKPKKKNPRHRKASKKKTGVRALVARALR